MDINLLNALTYEIRKAIYNVHNELGPDLFESVYEAALVYELASLGISVQSQVAVPVHYKSVNLDIGFKLDLLVENEVIIEIKSIRQLEDVHKKQLLTYLKLSNKRLGLLVNFNSTSLTDKVNLIRIIN